MKDPKKCDHHNWVMPPWQGPGHYPVVNCEDCGYRMQIWDALNQLKERVQALEEQTDEKLD